MPDQSRFLSERDFDDTPETDRQPGVRCRRSDGVDRGAYRVLRAHFRRQCAARHEPCHLCGQLIDYTLEYPNVMAWELDHFVPVVIAPELEMQMSNWRASHSRCNRGRATSAVMPECGEPSEIW